MRVLVACEFSGVVRDSFIRCGHEAVSCDLLPSEKPGPHIVGDVREIIGEGWDLIIAHPPCTFLSSSGARWWKHRAEEQKEAIEFARLFFDCACGRVAIENPIGILSTMIRKPEQIIQPWQFGHGETKATCLWLKGLPKLVPTNVVEGRNPTVHRMSPSKNRWKDRSRTYAGIARAMAEQWGGLL